MHSSIAIVEIVHSLIAVVEIVTEFVFLVVEFENFLTESHSVIAGSHC